MMKNTAKLVTIKRVCVINEVDDITKKITKVIIILNTSNREFINITDTSKMTRLEAICTAINFQNHALSLYKGSNPT